jgi:hydroxypyruvate reductase
MPNGREVGEEGMTLLESMRAEAKEIFASAFQAVDPHRAVRSFVSLEGDRLILGHKGLEPRVLDLGRYERVTLVGAGKATAPMAKALEEILGARIHRGIVNVKYGFAEPLKYTEIVEAGHPVPDENGLRGTRRILELLRSAGERDLVFSLISGGGSALLPQPAGGITLEDKQAVTRLLLACGASIDEINAVRKHISSSKGGQMARVAFPATTVNLMLSDVVGDRMDVIASGPFVPDPSTFHEVCAIFGKYGLRDLPGALVKHVEAGLRGEIPETPKTGEPVFDRVFNYVVGSNILALEAAAAKGKALGYTTVILSSMVEGETREVARVHSAVAKEVLKTGRPVKAPACIISGGETTVTLRGKGLGGRNQEFCLAAALDIAGLPERLVILSGGTDGNDGPTDAAGGVVDPGTVGRGRAQGLEARKHLADNDAYPFLEKTGDLLMTGPTKTNVMDVRLILVR